jgi:hypothetical protein
MGWGLPPPALVRPVTVSVADAADARLGESASHAGRMLELAYQCGDRDLALIWQRTMFDIVKLRQARRFGMDTKTEGANLGG